jgi:(p)ppGpp synthase/HD superfamily hydrolase
MTTQKVFDHERFFNLIVEAHHRTNHFYDEYLPYEFHLRMALTIGKRFLKGNSIIPEKFHPIILAAVIAHDSIEDARLTYNDVKQMALDCGATIEEAIMIAEMVRAVTNDGRGRDRDERMPDYIYEEIKTIYYSLFVKLCDRLANVQYGLITGGSMPKKYKKEHPHFKSKLYTQGLYEDMWSELENLFSNLK